MAVEEVIVKKVEVEVDTEEGEDEEATVEVEVVAAVVTGAVEEGDMSDEAAVVAAVLAVDIVEVEVGGNCTNKLLFVLYYISFCPFVAEMTLRKRHGINSLESDGHSKKGT